MSEEGRDGGEFALCVVQCNLDLWFLSHGHVETSPQTVFISFTSPFPEPSALLRRRLARALPLAFIFSSSSDKGVTSPTLTVET